ncbi:MAG: response regulator [Kofleriaceae bacterium]
MTADYVLLIEDDQAFREMLAYYLRAHGFTVVTVDDGAEALAHLEAGNQPFAIVADLIMPGVLGGSISDYLKQSPSHHGCPIMFVTGSPKLAPADRPVVAKPFQGRVVLEFVESARAAAIHA